VPCTVNDQNGGLGLNHGERVGRWEGTKVKISKCTTGEQGSLILGTLHDEAKRVRICLCLRMRASRMALESQLKSELVYSTTLVPSTEPFRRKILDQVRLPSRHDPKPD
jgi:hypothetical protein